MSAHTARPEPWQLVSDWFWLSHEDSTGRALLNPAHLGLGLASATLAGLMLSEHVVLSKDLILPASSQPPHDVLAHQVFSVIIAEPQPLEIRTWLSYLSRTAREDVAQNLKRFGLLHEQRSWLRRAPRYLPTDPRYATLPLSRLRALLIVRERPSLHEILLAGLTEATGLTEAVFDPDEVRTARDAVPGMVQQLPAALRALIAHTRAAVGAAVLAPHQ